jgi:hypothetical protein
MSRKRKSHRKNMRDEREERPEEQEETRLQNEENNLEIETFSDETEDIPMDQDDALDYRFIDAAADDDPMMDQIDDYTDDSDILEDFADRQGFTSGTNKLVDKLLDHNTQNPGLSGGDIDAGWDSSIVSGEESAGGSVSTPDQDVVDEIGEALGVTYEDDEELGTLDKLDERDCNRWELDPRSAYDDEEEERGPDERGAEI